MTQSRYLGLVVLLSLSAAACDTERTSAPQLDATGEDPIATLLAGSSVANTRSGGGIPLFDRLANEIASFGGLYRNGECAVAVVLTDMSEADHAIRVVKAAIEPLRSCPNGIRVQPVAGDFTYVELVRYADAAQKLERIDGVRGSKIDYKLNRLVIYVASREVARKVLEALPDLGIPAKAVVFEVGLTKTRG